MSDKTEGKLTRVDTASRTCLVDISSFVLSTSFLKSFSRIIARFI